jgi:hypothetical protein
MIPNEIAPLGRDRRRKRRELSKHCYSGLMGSQHNGCGEKAASEGQG